MVDSVQDIRDIRDTVLDAYLSRQQAQRIADVNPQALCGMLVLVVMKRDDDLELRRLRGVERVTMDEEWGGPILHIGCLGWVRLEHIDARPSALLPSAVARDAVNELAFFVTRGHLLLQEPAYRCLRGLDLPLLAARWLDKVVKLRPPGMWAPWAPWTPLVELGTPLPRTTNLRRKRPLVITPARSRAVLDVQ